MTFKRPSAPSNVTLSAAKSLYRPGREQNDRPAFSTKPPPYRVRSFGLRPQDDIQEALSPLRDTERSEESLPARLRTERPPGVFDGGPASMREILRASPSG